MVMALCRPMSSTLWMVQVALVSLMVYSWAWYCSLSLSVTVNIFIVRHWIAQGFKVGHFWRHSSPCSPSQEPLRATASASASRRWAPWSWRTGPAASQIDMAVIWVTKASKGSTQWTDDGTQRQLSHYHFRKKMKPLTVLIKTIYLGALGRCTSV